MSRLIPHMAVLPLMGALPQCPHPYLAFNRADNTGPRSCALCGKTEDEITAVWLDEDPDA
jgi:hypothetical protein